MTIKRTLYGAPILLLASMAGAQTPAKPIWASVGWSNLIGSDAKDATSTSGFQLGLGYHFGAKELGGYHYDPSLDFSWNRHSGHGNRLDTYSLLAMARAPFTAGAEAGKNAVVPYYGLGIGIARNEFNGHGQSTTGGSSGGNSQTGLSPNAIGGAGSIKNWTLAARGLVGVSFSESLFAEAAYNYNGSLGGSSVDTFSLSVGIRF